MLQHLFYIGYGCQVPNYRFRKHADLVIVWIGETLDTICRIFILIFTFQEHQLLHLQVA